MSQPPAPSSASSRCSGFPHSLFSLFFTLFLGIFCVLHMLVCSRGSVVRRFYLLTFHQLSCFLMMFCLFFFIGLASFFLVLSCCLMKFYLTLICCQLCLPNRSIAVVFFPDKLASPLLSLLPRCHPAELKNVNVSVLAPSAVSPLRLWPCFPFSAHDISAVYLARIWAAAPRQIDAPFRRMLEVCVPPAPLPGSRFRGVTAPCTFPAEDILNISQGRI